MTLHDVKIEPRWFERIRENEKFGEVRFDDRDYQTGDRIRFWRNDTEPEFVYSVERTITHVLRDVDGLENGFVVLSLADPRVSHLQDRLDWMTEQKLKAERSNAALRGANRRLRAGR